MANYFKQYLAFDGNEDELFSLLLLANKKIIL
jgi:hypothetical protein